MAKNIDRIARGVAGLLVVISVVLIYFVSPWFLLLTGIIGAGLFQSAFTDWCIVSALFRGKDTAVCGSDH